MCIHICMCVSTCTDITIDTDTDTSPVFLECPSPCRTLRKAEHLSSSVSCSELLSGCVKLLVVYVMLAHLSDPHNNPLRGEAWGPFPPFYRQGNSCVFMHPGAWRVYVLHIPVLLPLSRNLLSRLFLLLGPGGSATT